MMILAAILVALLFSILVLGLSFTRLRPGLLWLLVLLGTLVAWALVILAGKNLPIEVVLITWDPEFLLGSSPMLLLDKTVWPFAVAVVTISLAVLLTDIVHFRELDPQVWISNLALGGVGLLAVVAGNPLSLLLAWSVLDISELIVLLIRVTGSRERERVVVAFSVRVAGMFLLLTAMLQARYLNSTLSFQTIQPEATGLLLLSAGLRLGVIPPAQPYLSEPYLQRGLGSFARLVPLVSSLALVVRIATMGTISPWLSLFLFLTSITALYASINWLRAENELRGRSYWILGFAALAIAAAAQGLEGASAAWGFALLFSGSMLFLFSFRHRNLIMIPFLGLVGFCALPLTPAWEGISLFNDIPWGYRIIFIIALTLYLLGYLKHSRISKNDAGEVERWMWLVYPIGLLILPITHIGLSYLQKEQIQNIISFVAPNWWYGFIPLTISAILLILNHREGIAFPPVFIGIVEKINLDFFPRFFWRMYRLVGRLITLFSKLLEGEGGVLWALLILILLVLSLSFLGTGERFEF